MRSAASSTLFKKFIKYAKTEERIWKTKCTIQWYYINHLIIYLLNSCVTQQHFVSQYIPLLSNISVKPLENAFFIDKKLQSKIEVVFINRTKFIISFVKEKNFFRAVASVNTINTLFLLPC